MEIDAGTESRLTVVQSRMSWDEAMLALKWEEGGYGGVRVGCIGGLREEIKVWGVWELLSWTFSRNLGSGFMLKVGYEQA